MADVIFFDLDATPDATPVDHRSAVLEAIGQIVRAAPNATVNHEGLTGSSSTGLGHCPVT